MEFFQISLKNSSETVKKAELNQFLVEKNEIYLNWVDKSKLFSRVDKTGKKFVERNETYRNLAETVET